MKQDYTKSPRLFIENELGENTSVQLHQDHVHYLSTVLRKADGDFIRVFNGTDGEFLGKFVPTSKKKAELTSLKKLKQQPQHIPSVHLYFAPIKKDRMAFLIEKAVELGVTDIHPIITDRTENRKPNIIKLQSYIVEAAEQCERLDMPKLHPTCPIATVNFYNPTFAAIERDNYSLFTSSQKSLGIFIGPEGGWTDEERQLLINHAHIRPVSLGDKILRAETAALFMLARIAL